MKLALMTCITAMALPAEHYRRLDGRPLNPPELASKMLPSGDKELTVKQRFCIYFLYRHC